MKKLFKKLAKALTVKNVVKVLKSIFVKPVVAIYKRIKLLLKALIGARKESKEFTPMIQSGNKIVDTIVGYAAGFTNILSEGDMDYLKKSNFVA